MTRTMRRNYFIVMLALILPLPAAAQKCLQSESVAGAEVYFISPEDGATVTSPVRVVMGLRGMGIAPAGIDAPNTGHHHLFINREPPVVCDTPMPRGEDLLHFGGGQTEAEVDLPPGEHQLTLVLGNYLHIPHDPPIISETISVTVIEEN